MHVRHLADLALIAAGGVLLAVAFDFVPGADLPSIRPCLLAGWLLVVIGCLRLSAALPARRAAPPPADARHTFIA